jgi:hypothetical protein
MRTTPTDGACDEVHTGATWRLASDNSCVYVKPSGGPRHKKIVDRILG